LKVDTVLGPISPDSLGITLPHEHVFIDLSSFRLIKPEEGSLKFLVDAPVRMENLGVLRKNPLVSRDNLKLDDVHVAEKELLDFAKCNGKSVVDMSVIGMGRNPLGLREVSKETGVNILASTGWYRVESHPSYVKDKSIEDLKEIMVKELKEGIGDTGVRAGVIKCACTQPAPFHPQEKKVLQAAAQAQSETHAGLTVHPTLTAVPNMPLPTVAEAYLDVYEKEGGDPKKFYLSHSGNTLFDRDYHKRLLERGITLVFEFGSVAYGGIGILYYGGIKVPSELDKIRAVVELCRIGYDKQIMLSHDVCMKIMLKKYGGYGYSHVLESVVPILEIEGVTKKQIRNMLVENPKRILQKP